jgi:hypothetical protein
MFIILFKYSSNVSTPKKIKMSRRCKVYGISFNIFPKNKQNEKGKAFKYSQIFDDLVKFHSLHILL